MGDQCNHGATWERGRNECEMVGQLSGKGRGDTWLGTCGTNENSLGGPAEGLYRYREWHGQRLRELGKYNYSSENMWNVKCEARRWSRGFTLWCV